MPERKPKVYVTEEKLNIIKMLYTEKPAREIASLTKLSYSTVIKTIKKIVDSSDEVHFNEIFSKPGRKPTNNVSLYSEIRDIVGNDNSLTQVGIRERLSRRISQPQISRHLKNAGLKRKRLRKRPVALLTEENSRKRIDFCSSVMGFTNRNILFLDESGFNLHTSSNYGYAEVNRDPVTYQPNSKGRNISLCAIISINGVEHHKLVDGAYNIERFSEFISECYQKGVFQRNPLLIMDNVRFHHSDPVKQILLQFGVECLFLPPYNPELNPIENLFSTIKNNLYSIRPRAVSRVDLLNNVERSISMLSGTLTEYYRSFWGKVSAILNRQ